MRDMSKKLFPERTRCLQCRKKLEKVVLDGVYCSYQCAKLPQPSIHPEDAPRSCRREVNGVWGYKTRYRCEQEVPAKLRADPGTNVYRCDYCHFLHVGHSRLQPQQEKLRRLVADTSTLSSVVSRAMAAKNVDKRALAKRLGVPMLRITEIERGDPKMNINVLFQVLYMLRIKVELIET